jgi:hypothetical protein
LESPVISSPALVSASSEWELCFFESQASVGVSHQEITAKNVTPAMMMGASKLFDYHLLCSIIARMEELTV